MMKHEKLYNTIQENFPITLKDGVILFLNKILDYNEKSKTYAIDVYDNNGYKYLLNYKNLSRMNKTFPFNFCKEYITHNINQCLKNNNAVIRVGTVPSGSNTHTKLYVFRIDNEWDSFISWNDISKDLSRFNYQNIDTYIENVESRCITKDEVIRIIKEKEIRLNRPLIQSDFECVKTGENSVGIRKIYTFWGSFSNMIKDLGLLEHDDYFKPNSQNYLTNEKCVEIIINACKKAMAENRDTIMQNDFVDGDKVVNIKKLRNHCLLLNTTLEDLLDEYNCKLQKSGCGMNYKFEDDEIIKSRYEYGFSTFLRNMGYVYNKTYFRDVFYKDIDNKYTGNMNCDYKILLPNKILYVELAGILGNPEHIQCFNNNKPIKSKSKEQYRLKLNQKADILKRNGLSFYILLPPDMNETVYRKILNA